MKFRTILYVQLKLVCSAGVSPVRVRARSPVAWIARIRETKIFEAYLQSHLRGDEQVTRLQVKVNE